MKAAVVKLVTWLVYIILIAVCVAIISMIVEFIFWLWDIERC